MLDISTYQKLTTARLEEWAVDDGFTIFVRLPGGREARLTRPQWQAILDQYRQLVEPSARRLRRSFLLTIPVGIFLLALISGVPQLQAAAYALDRAIPFVLPLLITAGLPVYAIVRHALKVQKALDRARRQIALHPTSAASWHPGPRGASPFEKIAAFILVPHVLIQAWGTVDPDAYRNTPWTGTRLDWTAGVALLILAWLALRRWGAGRPPRGYVPDEARAERASDVVARARETASAP